MEFTWTVKCALGTCADAIGYRMEIKQEKKRYKYAGQD